MLTNLFNIVGEHLEDVIAVIFRQYSLYLLEGLALVDVRHQVTILASDDVYKATWLTPQYLEEVVICCEFFLTLDTLNGLAD